MKRFDYLAPTSLAEALSMLADRPDSLPLAGGTDLLVQVKERHRPVAALISLKRIPELHELAVNGALNLGAAVLAGDVAAEPRLQEDFTALAAGAGLIGSVQIRNMATVGGNLCNASPSADTAPALLVLEATAVIAGPGGERLVSLADFFLGPGRTVLQPGELLRAVTAPKPPPRTGSFYLRATPRSWMDIAVVGVGAAITLDGRGGIQAARIALGAVAPTPLRALAAEALLPGRPVGEELWREAGQAAAAEARPIDDLRASAEYRHHLVDVLTRRALREAFRRAMDYNG